MWAASTLQSVRKEILLPLPFSYSLLFLHLSCKSDQSDKLACIVNQHQLAGLQTLLGKFMTYAPHFKGPVTPDIAIRDVIKVWENASIEKGDGGAFLSHLGNKQWL